MQAVTESGLYALIFKSRVEKAQDFRKWVTSEVLPAIRKDGFYVQTEAVMAKYPVCAKFSEFFGFCRKLDMSPDAAGEIARSLMIRAGSTITEPKPKAPTTAPKRNSATLEKNIGLLSGHLACKPQRAAECQQAMAAAHGWSRATFYRVLARGRKSGAIKANPFGQLTSEIHTVTAQ
jgi:hypothetical protein